MATRKIQNFVKSKVSAHSNISIPFSKQRFKGDSQEEPLIFENLDSDKEEADNEDEYSKNVGNTNNSNEKEETVNVVDTEVRNVEDYEMLGYDQDGMSSTTNSTALRARVDSIGKSVNSAFRDAHSALNAIMKEKVKKKGIRKPSEVTKSRRFGSFGKRKVAVVSVIKEEDNCDSSGRTTACDIEEADEDEESFECVITDRRHSPIDNIACDNLPPSQELEKDDYSLRSDGNMSDSPVPTTIEENINNAEIEQPINFTNLKIFAAIGLFIFMFFIFSISKFILGLLCGILMSFGLFKIYESFFSTLNDVPTINHKHPNLRDLLSPVIPHIEEVDLIDEYASPKASFSTWVNSVNSYHPSWFNIAASYSLHLSLEGTSLVIRRPKGKVPTRAMWNETKLSGLTLVNERTVELLHAKVHLLPYGLVRRRMWSKKYPICVTINKNVDEKASKSSLHLSRPLGDQEVNAGEENFFFFTRTCRDKEEMFRRLISASLGMPINLTISDIVDKYLSKEVFSSQAGMYHDQDVLGRDGSVARQKGVAKVTSGATTTAAKEPQIVTYVRYMAKFMPSDTLLLKAKSNHIDLNYISCEPELLWLNGLLGRVAWDVFRGGHWINVIRDKIQRKLRKLHLPYFVDQLEVVDIDLGTEVPVIRKVSRPYLDYKGLWIEFEVVYAGGFSMGLETKMNLMKLKNQHNKASQKPQKAPDYVAKFGPDPDEHNSQNNNEAADADGDSADVSVEARMQMSMTTGGGAVNAADDSDGENKVNPAISSDESYASSSDSDMPGEKLKGLSHSTSNKSFLQWVDKIARSSYFQKAADNKYVLRTMEYVSNTSLQLQVDAQYLSGTLVVNIPPPPSDRLWWGFKKSPQLSIRARPKVGQKEIQMSKLVEFIEKKLLQEFHRAAVLPNMDDIVIPLLFNGSPDKYSQSLL